MEWWEPNTRPTLKARGTSKDTTEAETHPPRTLHHTQLRHFYRGARHASG